MGILVEPWPGDLDPARVPFRQRTIAVLKGMRLWDDMTRIDELTVDDIAGYWVTGFAWSRSDPNTTLSPSVCMRQHLLSNEN